MSELELIIVSLQSFPNSPVGCHTAIVKQLMEKPPVVIEDKEYFYRAKNTDKKFGVWQVWLVEGVACKHIMLK